MPPSTLHCFQSSPVPLLVSSPVPLLFPMGGQPSLLHYKNKEACLQQLLVNAPMPRTNTSSTEPKQNHKLGWQAQQYKCQTRDSHWNKIKWGALLQDQQNQCITEDPSRTQGQCDSVRPTEPMSNPIAPRT